MAKATVSVPSRSYAPGTRTVNLPNLTTDDAGVVVSLTREAWPDTGSNVISGTVDGSDDGVNWFNLTVFGYPGGNQINPRTGLPVTACVFKVTWPERNDGSGNLVPQRPAQVRAVITNTVTLTTAITLTGA